MTAWICATCGVQQPETASPPAECPICLDERQYLPPGGQRWTSLDELAAKGHRTETRLLEADLLGVGVTPSFAIGERALVVRSGGAGLLWDVPGYIDDDAIAQVREFCRLEAVSASHPHFYGVMAEWSDAFDGIPILIPEADLEWVQRRDANVETWTDRREVLPGVALLQCGGHFPGSAVVHWTQGADGRGALLAGDSVGVVSDRRYVSFMRSFPNEIPLGAPQLEKIARVLEPVRYDRIYGGWWNSVVDNHAKEAVARSLERYLRWISGAGTDA